LKRANSFTRHMGVFSLGFAMLEETAATLVDVTDAEGKAEF